MKRNINIFIMIGCVVFVRGQLQGLPNEYKMQNIEKLSNDIHNMIDRDYDENYFFQVNEGFDNLVNYIRSLNRISEKGKKKLRLVIDDFTITASALEEMDLLINSLHTKLSKKFAQHSLLSRILNNSIDKKRKTLSDLKIKLYKTYEVTKKENNKIAILYYAWLPTEDKQNAYYSDPYDDPLANIKPSVSTIEEQRMGTKKFTRQEERIAEEKSKKVAKLTFMQVLAIEAAAVLAIVMIKQLAGPKAIEAGVGVIKDTIAKTVKTAIIKGKSAMEAAKNAVETIMKMVIEKRKEAATESTARLATPEILTTEDEIVTFWQ